MRKAIAMVLVILTCLSISVSCARKEKKEEKKDGGVVEEVIKGPIEKANEVKEKSNQRADEMEKQADEVLKEDGK